MHSLAKKVVLIALVLFFSSIARAQTTRTAPDCTVAGIQGTVNASANGDTVLVPAATAHCNTEATKVTWNTVLTINPGITLNGQGAFVQFTSPGELLLNANTSTGARITGFTFDGSYNEAGACGGPIHLVSNTPGATPTMAYRFDHNTINNGIGAQATSNTVALCPFGWGPGVIDHNTFNSSQFGETIQIWGQGSGFTDGPWTNDVTPGGSNFVFLEDNTCINTISPAHITAFLASYYGAKWVARHNNLTGCTFDAHAGTSVGNGVRWTELYQNTYTQITCGPAFMSERAGTGVVWGNILNPHGTFDGCSNQPANNLGPDCPSSDVCTGNWPLAYGTGRGIESPAGTFNYSPYYSWGNDSFFAPLQPQFTSTFNGPSPYVEIGATPSDTACTGNLYNGSSVSHAANVCDGVEFGSSAATPPIQLVKCQSAADVIAGCPRSYTYAPYTYPNPLVTGSNAPIVSLNPTSEAFGNVNVGSTSPSKTVVLSNTGNATLGITVPPSLTGTNPADFSLTNNCGSSVLAGGSCNLVVSCTPASAASFSASISITDNAAGSPHTVPLTCTGVTASAGFSPNPTSLTFADQTIGTSSTPKPIIITNNGTGAALTFTSIKISGGASTSFSQTNNCVSVVQFATCTVNVTFTPQAAGALASTVSFTDNAAGSPQTVPISGNGAGVPGIAFNPTSVAFGNQAVSSTSSPTNVVITNNGTATLTISGKTIIGTNASDFAISSDGCGGTLAVNAQCTVSLTFTPGATGNRTATLSVTDTAPASPQAVALTGTGTQSGTHFVPTSIAFGNQTVNVASASSSTVLTNNGTATLNISSITVTGTNATDFVISSNSCGATLASSATCTVSIIFTPDSAGPKSASISFDDDAPNTPQTVPLTGTGVASSTTISVQPSSINFGNVIVNASSSALSVTVTNTGASAVTISSIAITGGNSGDFHITSNNCPASLPIGNPPQPGVNVCTVKVSFKPTATGLRSSALVFTDSASNSPQSVSLQGTGTQAAVGLVPTSITFPNTAVGSTASGMSTTLTNTGTATLTLSPVVLTGTNPSYFAISANTCGSTVAAGASCTVTITFTPQTGITAKANITFRDNAPGTPQLVPLTGTGVSTAMSFTPASIAFGNQATSTTSAAKTTKASNTGNGTVTLTSITITGTNASDFTQTNNCGASIGPVSNCTVTVKFTPGANGARTANLVFTDSAPASPQTVALSGTGFTPGPSVCLTLTTVPFGNQATSTLSNKKTVVLTNTGTASLTISSTSITGTNASDFAKTTTCGGTLAANATCTYSFSFTPGGAGSRSATFNLTTNAPSSPDTIALSGTGVTNSQGAPAPQVSGNNLQVPHNRQGD